MKTTSTFLLIFFAFALQAQENISLYQSNGLQLDVGLIQLKEENLHPKVHRGLLYGLKYEHVRLKTGISAFQIGMGFSRLKTKYEALSASANVQLQGGYQYLIKITNTNKLTYHLGPEINLVYDLSYFPNWDESHLYWAGCLDLGIGNKFIYHINTRQSFVLDLDFSLVSVFSRPELDRQYKIDDISIGSMVESLNSNPEGGTINKSANLSLMAEYRFHIGEKITQAICYSSDYKRIKRIEGLHLQVILHKIGLKIYF